MNVKNNKRRRQSQEKIEKAFIELLQTKELMQITVSEICSKTSLNRSTFYANYVDVFDLADKISGKYDIVRANIVADVVIRLFDNVADFMKDDGILIVSGIIDMRADEVEKSAVSHGFKIAESLTREEWHAYVLTK